METGAKQFEDKTKILNAEMSCAGILIVIFFVTLRAVLSLRCLIRKVPKPQDKHSLCEPVQHALVP